MEKYEFLEPTDVKNFWKKYGLTGNTFMLPCKPVFSFFFLSQTTPTAFLVVVKRPPLHFLGDLTQALLRELARAELLHTSRTCST